MIPAVGTRIPVWFGVGYNFPVIKGLPVMQIVIWCWCIFIGLIMVINAVVMLVSPRAWLRLPGWLRAQGKFATGWGGLHVRLTGALILASIAWVLYEMLWN